jgi:hypothetical protein
LRNSGIDIYSVSDFCGYSAFADVIILRFFLVEIRLATYRTPPTKKEMKNPWIRLYTRLSWSKRFETMPKAKKRPTIQSMITAFEILNVLFDWVEEDIFLSVMTLG